MRASFTKNLPLRNPPYPPTFFELNFAPRSGRQNRDTDASAPRASAVEGRGAAGMAEAGSGTRTVRRSRRARGLPPPEDWRDWAGGLPDEVLAQVAEKIVASRAEAMWAEKRTTERLNNLELLLLQLHKLEDQIHSSTSFAELVERHNQARADTIQDADVGAAKMRFFDHNKDSLFPFAMVCKAWRKAQLKVGGPLLTRVESDLIAPGRAALVKWALAEGCPRDREWEGDIDTLATRAAAHGHLEIVQFLCCEQGFMDWRVQAEAIMSDQNEVVRWLRANGCPDPPGLDKVQRGMRAAKSAEALLKALSQGRSG